MTDKETLWWQAGSGVPCDRPQLRLGQAARLLCEAALDQVSARSHVRQTDVPVSTIY
jgi:hypothetical protein